MCRLEPEELARIDVARENIDRARFLISAGLAATVDFGEDWGPVVSVTRSKPAPGSVTLIIPPAIMAAIEKSAEAEQTTIEKEILFGLDMHFLPDAPEEAPKPIAPTVQAPTPEERAAAISESREARQAAGRDALTAAEALAAHLARLRPKTDWEKDMENVQFGAKAPAPGSRLKRAPKPAGRR